VSKPEPLFVRSRGKDVRIRHDDPLLGPYSAVIQRLQSAMTITTEVATLRLVMAREWAYECRCPTTAARSGYGDGDSGPQRRRSAGTVGTGTLPTSGGIPCSGLLRHLTG
jgi:hypothetical protein